MNRQSVGEGDYPQDSIAKFIDRSPKPNPFVSLRFDADRVLNNKYTPFLSQIRSFAENLVLKVGREFVRAHEEFLPQSGRGAKAKASSCARPFVINTLGVRKGSLHAHAHAAHLGGGNAANARLPVFPFRTFICIIREFAGEARPNGNLIDWLRIKRWSLLHRDKGKSLRVVSEDIAIL